MLDRDVERVAYAAAECVLSHPGGQIGHVDLDASARRAMEAGDRPETSLLRRVACMDLEEGGEHLGAIAVLEVRAPRDRLAPRVEPGTDGKEELTRGTQRARLPERQEAMVLVRDQGLVQVTGADEERTATCCVRMREAHVTIAERREPVVARPLADDAREVTEIVRDDRRDGERISRAAGLERLAEDRLFAIELGIDLRGEAIDEITELEDRCTAERAGADGEPLAVVTRDRSVRRRDERARGDGVDVPSSDPIDDVACGRERVFRLDRLPCVVANACIDVRWHERRDRRVVRREEQREISRSFTSMGGLCAGDVVEHAGRCLCTRIVPQPGSGVLYLTDEQLGSDSGFHAAMVVRGSRVMTGRRRSSSDEQQRATARTDVLGGMPVARFLREHWQKKPLLVRNAFPGFRDPITPDELAGLSCEEGVESRIVREKGGAKPWEVTWGPHPESVFASLPDRDWTLLVQEVNRWVPEAALLLDRFGFIPNVRVDDVMVSYAEPGGNVGPHLDSYDVFLIQGQGERRWRWHTSPTKDTRLVPDLDLRVLAKFRPDADEVLGPGDMLYLPPGFAHHGVAVTPCLTYSIGFRSPGAGEVWGSFAASAKQRPEAARLLEDPELSAKAHPGAIPPALLARVREMVRSMDTSDEMIDRWFASFATRLKPGHGLEPPRRAPDSKKIAERLSRGDTVARSEEGRWAFLPRARGALLLYVGGEELEVPAEAAELAQTLCSARRHDGRALKRQASTSAARALLVRLFAMGALRFGR